MFSYVFMKILEGRPRSYDRRMDKASRGRVGEIKASVVKEVPQAPQGSGGRLRDRRACRYADRSRRGCGCL